MKQRDILNGRYWDLPLSLVDGCTPCSPGCDHCWSAGITHRFHSGRGENIPGCYVLTTKNGKFDGNIITHTERLSIPLKRKKPTVYAIWNDLFHEGVPPEFTFEAFDAMRNSQRHTFLVLTKRPQNINHNYFEIMERCIQNVYLGLTVCNQQEWDEKWPIFSRVPGLKFVSHEPALSAINYHFSGSQEDVIWRRTNGGSYERSFIACLISGGETGPGARPSHPDIFRYDRDQCAAAGVLFFFKGSGDGRSDDWRRKLSPDEWNQAKRLLDGRTHDVLSWRAL